MKQNLMLNKKSPNSKLNFCFDPLPYIWSEGMQSYYFLKKCDQTFLLKMKIILQRFQIQILIGSTYKKTKMISILSKMISISTYPAKIIKLLTLNMFKALICLNIDSSKSLLKF